MEMLLVDLMLLFYSSLTGWFFPPGRPYTPMAMYNTSVSQVGVSALYALTPILLNVFITAVVIILDTDEVTTYTK